MRARTEEFLYLLLWTADQLMRPGLRNLNNSFESWAYRNGFQRQIAQLERQGWIEGKARPQDDRLYRLTAPGRLHALGGRDPETQWRRPWDGKWRMVLFDIATGENAERARLRRYLRNRRFGYLQNSVWISPDPLEEERRILADGRIDVESLILMEGQPCSGESHEEIVAGAWDFERINRSYARHLKLLNERPREALRGKVACENLRRWAAAERDAWKQALSEDPLLPKRLLPSDYLGERAWRRRLKTLQQAGRQLQTFRGA